MAISYQHKEIWDALICLIPNPYGVAGLMGNLFAESSLNPKCVTGGGLKTNAEKESYIRDVNTGVISINLFAHDGVAFGLAQWAFWQRKENFITYVKENHMAVDNLLAQLNYIQKEISTHYKTVWNTLLNATSVKEASDIVMERYEKPANMSDKAKEKRAAFGQECYELFAEDIAPGTWYKYVVTKVNKINLRTGPGTDYGIVIQAKKEGEKYEWVADAMNNWHAIIAEVNGKKRVLWISPDYSEVRSG